ncbi:MAG TPA: alpha-hydroxy acid oxidase, partial [Acidimicrobiales bacterium]|nr:alpha-hydroxy acid oxidase [Acidimicrobiales bacterium]
MKPSEIAHILRVARPPAPDGAWSLARCYSIEDVAKKARRRLPLGARAYLDGGSQDEHTLRRNREALDRPELLPRQPRDVRDLDTSTTILGEPSPLPIVLSPIGGPRMFHHEGELAVARAARRAGIPYGISTLGTTAVEDVAAQTDTPLWLQLYVWGDRSCSKEVVKRAKRAGYRALLLSLDTNVRSKREREKHSGLELPDPELPVTTVLEGALHPSWSWHFLTSPTISFPNIGPADQRSLQTISDMFDGSVSWADLEWIRELWDGPIVAKGVMRPEEAVEAAEHGLDGVIVSNHGGRQLDHQPATIDVLPGIVDAVGDRLEVMVD